VMKKCRTELKTIVMSVALLCGAAMTPGMHAQTAPPANMPKDDLFAGTEKFAANASDVTELNMDPQTLGMVGGKSAARAHRMLLNVVRSYTYDKPGMYNIADVEAIRNRLNTGDWHCSVHTRDSKRGESTDICNKAHTDGVVETAIITVEPKELTFIHTIRQGGEGESGNHSFITVPGAIDGTSGAAYLDNHAEMGVQMAILRAEMKALGPELQVQMAELKPEMELDVDHALVWKQAQPDSNAPQKFILRVPATPPPPAMPTVPAH
jgi:hypothetical protein